LLTYPDGSRKHIDREERDYLLLSQSARKTSEGRYLYTGPIHTYNSFEQLKDLSIAQEPANLRRFLPGSFIFEHKGKKRFEMLESAEHLAVRYVAGQVGA
jgi:hypothetical protein